LAGVDDGRVCAVLDAGRGEFYVGEYAGRRAVREALIKKEEVEADRGECAFVVCEVAVANALEGLRPKLVREPVAGDALTLAEERVVTGEFDDVATLDANYLRRTDAQIFAKPKTRDSRS